MQILFIIGVMQDNFLNKKFKYKYWNVVPYIVVINALIFAVTQFFDIRIKGINIIYWLSLVPYFVQRGCIWQFVTYMFVHNNTTHLLFNMYSLLLFGITLERMIGSKEFILFYFLTGALGGVANYAVMVMSGALNTVTLGASGAVYALLFLNAVLFPNARILLFFVLPLRMPVAVAVFMLIEMVCQVTGADGGVAHLVHLLCMFAAWLYCIVRFRISPIKVWKNTL